MTTPDIAGLCERLQMIVSELQGLPHVVETCREGKDTIERQAAEIKRLREALTDLLADECDGDPIARARAALTGEDA
jgi:hypothetical protein